MNAKVQLILELKERMKAGLTNSRRIVNESVQDMKNKINSLKNTHIEAFKEMGSAIPGFDAVMQALGNPYLALIAGATALGGAYVSSVNKAISWEKGMAKVNVTAQLTRAELARLSDQVLDIGANNVGILKDTPDSFNKIVSAGLDVKTSLASLDPILKGAKAGFSDVGTVAAATVATMNSTGIKSATEILDVLFATVNKGNAEFSDIANYMPKIIPMANSAGVSFKDMAGAFAYLTAQGFRAEAAATGLENTFKAISDPNTVKGLKKIGVSVYDIHGQTKPLLTIIGDLKARLDGLSDRKRGVKLATAGFDMESKKAIFSMIGDYDKLKDTIGFTNAAQGQLNEAIANAKTSTDSWAIIYNKVEAFFIKVGQTALPIIDAIGNGILNAGAIINSVTPYLYALAAGIGAAGLAYVIANPAVLLYGAGLAINAVASGALAIATGVLTAAQWALNVAMNANPIGLIVTGIGLVVGLFVLAYQKSEKFRAALAGIWEVAKLLSDIFIGLGKVILGAMTFNPALFKEGAMQSAVAITKVMNGGISDAFNKGYDESIAKSKAKELEEQKNQAKAPDAFANVKNKSEPGKGKTKLDNSGAKSIEKIVGGSQQTRNITINIDAFNKGGINVSNTEGLRGMSAKDIEAWFREMLQRELANVETSYN